MKQDVREMIKNVIEENAIKFKTSTSTALYQKIGNRLKDEYKNVAKKMFKSLNESAPAIALGDTTAVVGAETAMKDGGEVNLPSFSARANQDAPPIPRGPNGEQGMTIEEFVKKYHKKKEDFDSREEWTKWLEEYYRQYIEMMQQWDRERRWRERRVPEDERGSPTRFPSWKEFRQREDNSQPLPKRWLEQPV
jgi:molybdopterin converting factor small subunit